METGVRSTLAPEARLVDLAWVGWESNPRGDGLRVRCKASVCYRPAASVVPPSGIEPEPLGFQPSAPTPATQEWEDRATHERPFGRPARGAGFFCNGCLPGHPHRHRSSVVIERPCMRGTHLGPGCDRCRGGRTCRGLMIWNPDHQYAKSDCGELPIASTAGPRNDYGPPGFPGGPWAG